MRRMRFAVLAIASFLVALFGAILTPGTWVNRAIATVMCTIIGFDSTACMANLGQRVVAANPPAVEKTISQNSGDWLGQRSSEFDNTPTTPPPSNTQAPPYPQDPGPKFPIRRPDFDDDPNSTRPTQPTQPNRLTPANSGISNEPCNPTLLTTSAQPAKEVIIKGVPVNYTELEVLMLIQNPSFLFPIAYRRLENQDIAIVVPIHPTNGKEGGPINIVLESHENFCPILNFKIQPLPSKPGTTDKFIDNLEKFQRQMSVFLGINYDLFSEHNVNNLRDILSRKNSLDINLLDSLIDSSGIISILEKTSFEINKISSEDKIRNSNLSILNNIDKVFFKKNKINYKLPVSESKINDCLNIDNAQDLSDCLKYYAQLKEVYENYEVIEKRVVNIGAGITLAAIVSYVLSASSVVALPTTTALLGTLDAIASVIINLLIFVRVLFDIGFGILPNTLVEINFNISKYKFTKNDNSPGLLQKVSLSANRKGWKIIPQIINDLTNYFIGKILEGVVKNVKQIEIRKLAKKLNIEIPIFYKNDDFREKLTSLIKLVEENSSEIIEKVLEKMKGKVEKYEKPEANINVDATPSKYPQLIEAQGLGDISLNFSNDSYTPTQHPGNGTLTVKTKPGQFGKSQEVSSNKSVMIDGDEPPPPPSPQPPQPCCGGNSWGDPHLVTFDGLKYDHQAVGEFLLAKSTDGAFEVQVRESPVTGSSTVSLNTAAAMKVGNTRVAFYSKDFPDSDTNNLLRVDGKPTVIQGGTLSLPGGGSINQLNQGAYIVQWPTGEQVSIETGQFHGIAYINVNPGLPQSRQGQITGLLGNFNGNQNDDLTSRDGKVLPPQSSINQVSQITQSLTNWLPIPLNQVESVFLEELHKQFGDSWRISQAESLFDYPPGKNTASFTNSAFPNRFQILRILLPQQVQEAEKACRAAGVPQERLEGCLFDVGVTGDADFAKIGANLATNFIRKRANEEIQRRLPIPIPGLHF